MARKQGYKPISEWSDERKQKHIEYDQIHYSVIGAKLPRDQADIFRDICKRNNISVSAALSVFVRAAIQAGTLDIIRGDIPGTRDDDGTTAAGSCMDDDGRRENADQQNDTPGPVDFPKNASE
jgi:hypothetical protein